MTRRYRSKIEWLSEKMRGREILYIGSVDASEENFNKHKDLQGHLQKSHQHLLGVYCIEEHVERMRLAGLPAVAAEIESLDIDGTFDCIVCSDNIEHLTNCGGFLQSLSRHLTDNGCILVSTPNPTSLVRVLELLFRGKTKANLEHTCWFTAQVLDQLAGRYGLRLQSESFIDEMRNYHRIRRDRTDQSILIKALSPVLVGFNSLICAVLPQFSETYGFELQKPTDSHRA